MKSLTTSARRAITADWLGQFQGLGEYEPLHLLRRVGPLLEGIVLERTSGNDTNRAIACRHVVALSERIERS